MNGYTDSAEDFLFNFFDDPQSRKIKQISEVLGNDPPWPVLYHLSPQREMLLNWYPFNQKSTVLEVGAGCGALTGLLTEKLLKVYANELTVKRSQIIQKRYSDKKNLEVLSGNLSELELKKPVDYIVVVGVLEYSGRYFKQTGDEDIYAPYLRFLKQLKKFLSPKSKLLLAIENKIGLKYIAGGKEDHYGTLFSSLEDYPNDTGIRTFSKTELSQLFHKAGYKKLKFYYPFPDYKLPEIVFAEDFFKGAFNLPTSFYAEIKDKSNLRLFLFNEIMFAKTLVGEGVMDKFANSFLVEAGI